MPHASAVAVRGGTLLGMALLGVHEKVHVAQPKKCMLLMMQGIADGASSQIGHGAQSGASEILA